MRVAFDLDNTLIRCGHNFPLERPRHNRLVRLLGREGLRQGIVELVEHCRQSGWEVWVYTTSYRNAWHIRRLFWLHGIVLDGVLRQLNTYDDDLRRGNILVPLWLTSLPTGAFQRYIKSLGKLGG